MDVQAVQRRTLRVLVAGQLAAAAALSSAVTVGAYVVQTILGQSTPWGGIATATVTTGTAFMSQVLARLMSRSTRRRGLQTGYAMAIVGGLTAGVGAETKLLPVFIIGLFVYGSGQASNLLSRYAATDLAVADQRATAMSRILFASTFGAVLGPVLVQPAQWAGEELFGWHKYTGPWVFSAAFFIFSMLNAGLRLKPDPLELARELRGETVGQVPQLRIRQAYAAAFETVNGRVAVFAMVVSQMTMVAVMTMTPVHLKFHGHETVNAYIISLHIAGMYAFSPFVGRFSDKHGRQAAIRLGGFLLVCATAFSALSGDHYLLLFPALWLLGVGWSFGLIGGSSLLIDSVRDDSRVAVQGVADMSMSFFGGVAGFSSGFIRKAVGYHLLSTFSLVLAMLMVVVALWVSTPRRPSRAVA